MIDAEANRPGLDRDDLLVFADELMQHGSSPERVQGAQMAALLGVGATPGKVRARWALWKLGRNPGAPVLREAIYLDGLRRDESIWLEPIRDFIATLGEETVTALDLGDMIKVLEAMDFGFSPEEPRARRRQRFPRPSPVRMSSQVPRRTPRRRGIGRRA